MGKLSTIKRNILIIISAIIISAILLAAIFYPIVAAKVRHKMRELHERHLFWCQRSRDVIGSIRPGLSEEEVIKIAKENGFPEKWIHKRDSELLIGTPAELLLENWCMIFGFSNNKLTYVKVRTPEDFDAEEKPEDAPDDIIYSPNDINE